MRKVCASAEVIPAAEMAGGRDGLAIGEGREEEEAPTSSEGRGSECEGVSTATAAAAKLRRYIVAFG